MKKLVIVFAMVACLIGVTGQASAATTGNISVTVSLVSVTSVSVTPGSWSIGEITFGQIVTLTPVTATNNGTEPINLTITGANGAGTWVIGGSSDADQFSVEAKNGAPSLTNTDSHFLINGASPTINVSSITAGNSQVFDLVYTAPSSNTDTVGASQGFTIVITASAS